MIEKRRRQGEGGLHWSEKRQRWIAEATVGYDGRGKRVVRTGSGKSETAALRAMRERVREYEAGIMPDARRLTVAEAVEDWLLYERSTVSDKTLEGNERSYLLHIKPHLGGRRLRDLRAQEVDRWLLGLSKKMTTSSVKQVRGVLQRSVKRAVKLGRVERNVVDLCDPPKGRPGRRPKSLTLQQASDVIAKTRGHSMHAYIATSLLTGLRPEEVRALRWDRVHLDAKVPYIEVWRSVRLGGDTKTPKSRRTLAIAGYVVQVLEEHRKLLEIKAAADGWREHGLVFPSEVGTEQDSHNVRRKFREALEGVPGIVPSEWTPYELRHSFVSILSEHGLPIEEISRLMGHSGTAVTELVYRHELRPVLESGATIMDSVFGLNMESVDGDERAT